MAYHPKPKFMKVRDLIVILEDLLLDSEVTVLTEMGEYQILDIFEAKDKPGSVIIEINDGEPEE